MRLQWRPNPPQVRPFLILFLIGVVAVCATFWLSAVYGGRLFELVFVASSILCFIVPAGIVGIIAIIYTPRNPDKE